MRQMLLLLFIILLGNYIQMNAQVFYPYKADFETQTTNKNAKLSNSYEDINMNGLWWRMPAVYLGPMNASDRYNGHRSARIGVVDVATGIPGMLYMIEDVGSGISELSFQAALSDTFSNDSISVYYSIDQGDTWELVATDAIVSNSFSTYHYTINIAGNIRIKIEKATRKYQTINLDDIEIRPYCNASDLCLVNKFPLGNHIYRATDSITITFSEDIALGTGNVYVYEQTGTLSQTFDVTTASVSIDSNQLTIFGLTLANDMPYYVLMDAGVVTKASDGTILNDAVISETEWTFETIDTNNIFHAPYSKYYINDSFAICNSNSLGNFTAFSITGIDVWHCYTDTANDFQNYATISGHNDSGNSRENFDLLIFDNKIHALSIHGTALGYYFKTEHTGAFKVSVVASENFNGKDPLSADWIISSVVGHDITPDGWTFTLTSLDGLFLSGGDGANSFHVGLLYESDTTSAPTIYINNIEIISGYWHASNHTLYNMNVAVLGLPTSNEIKLQVEANKAEMYTAEVVDINGKVLHTTSFQVNAGMNYVNLNHLSLAAGMHAVRIYNKDFSQRGAVKAIVR